MLFFIYPSACFSSTTLTGNRRKFSAKRRRKRKVFMGETRTGILEEQNQSIDTGDYGIVAVAES